MRRFELVEGSASKFWEVSRDGAAVTVRFGRIGTNGQEKTKTHASDAAAIKDLDTLVREKTGKGYSEVGGEVAADGASSSQTSAAPAPAPAPRKTAQRAAAPVAAVTETETETAPEAASTSTSAPAPAPTAKAPVPAAAPAAGGPLPAIDWPSGGLTWTAALIEALPPLRGVHAPEGPAAASLETALPRRDPTYVHYHKADLERTLLDLWPGFTRWTNDELAQRLTRDALQDLSLEDWVQCFLQALTADFIMAPEEAVSGSRPQTGLRWLTEWALALRGVAFATDIAIALGPIGDRHYFAASWLHDSALRPIRRELARCDDATHAQVEERLGDMDASVQSTLRIRAMLFPRRLDWVRQLPVERDHFGVFLDATLPIEEILERLREFIRHRYVSQMKSGLLLQLRQHGEAAAPLLTGLLGMVTSKESITPVTGLLQRLRAPALPRLLATMLERPEVRDLLDRIAETHPAAVIASTAGEALSGRNAFLESWLQRLVLRAPDALAVAEQELAPELRDRLHAVLARNQAAECPAEQLPALLRDLPWTRKVKLTPLPTLDLTAAGRAVRIALSPAESAAVRVIEIKPVVIRSGDKKLDEQLSDMQIRPEGRARILAGVPLEDGDFVLTKKWFYGVDPEILMTLPPAPALALWNSYPSRYWNTWYWKPAYIHALLDRHGEAAVPGLIGLVAALPEIGLPIANAVDSVGLVPAMLHTLRNLKKAKPAAIAWANAHPGTFLAGALVSAFSADKTARENGQHGLRWFMTAHGEAPAREAAAAFGPEVEAALRALIDADPLLVLPARMPKLPAFAVTLAMRRPVLRENGLMLSGPDAESVALMLAISKVEAPYAGIVELKALCTPGSLSAFVWDLCEAWLQNGAPAKEGWAFQALGLFGDDDTARRLAARIREWPGESAHQRAVSGLDLLVAIGTDAALMHLNGIAGKVKFKGLQDRAREKIAALAEARGLTSEELADRLVPDLGLDEGGTLTLDFGPRQFRIGFDESLKPFVRDGAGARLKDLPKPIRSDDAALAGAATERYKLLKKDAKAIASLQVMRMELAMTARRRWTGEEFRAFFLSHPLMRHLAARVAWGVYEGDRVTRLFRVAEDWTLADAQDDTAQLADGETVGIAHPLEIPAAELAAMGQVFADYEILQPFRQLGRETYALTDAERTAKSITRFADKAIATGSVLGLVNRGWERGQAQDAGWVGQFERPVGAGLSIELELDPGTIVGDPTYEPKQRIPRIVLRRQGTWGDDGLETFDRLHAVVASEMLRDADLLAPWKEPAQ
ncbi:DUF4132 domain-containing protein [Roseateles chitinivorans]|uniref:WGR and DUF4132 domain-containing protein n=1 Tax=Roseateles chitinivorans TaxID=2917965 RepID=UPI003D66A82F